MRRTGTRRARAVLLDLDGTVADSNELMYRCYCFALQTHLGQEGSRKLWERHAGRPLFDVFEASYESLDHPLSEEGMNTLVGCYRGHMHEIHDQALKVFPGVPEALVELKEHGALLAIVTTKFEQAARRHLEFLGIAPLFDAVVTGDQCQHYKPHPEPFLRALERLGVAPGEAAAVGDSEHDIRSARAAGVLTAAACWGTLQRESLILAGPDVVLEDPGELPGLVGEPVTR